MRSSISSHWRQASITLLLLMALAAETLGQPLITGHVSDAADGLPLTGAHIRVEGSYLVGISDSEGNFRISGLKSGTFKLQASHIGYNTLTQDVDATHGTIRVSFRLQSREVVGQEVTVQAYKAGLRTPVAYTNIGTKEIRGINLGQDLPTILEMAPSVTSSSDAGTGIGYSNLRIRGTDQNRINVTINGIPLNDAESHGVFWVDLPDLSGSLEDLQIVRGVGTSTLGAGAFGASLNLRTKAPSTLPYADVNLSGGSFNTMKGSLSFGTGIIDGHWNIEGKYSYIKSDGFIDRAWSKLNSLYGSAAYYGNRSSLRLKVFNGSETTYQAWDGIPSTVLDTNRTYNGIGAYENPDGESAFYENQVDDYQQTHVHLYYDQKLRENTLMSLALHYTRGLGYYEEYRDDREFVDYAMEKPVVGGVEIETTDLIQRRFLDNHFAGFIANAERQKGRLELMAGMGWNIYDGLHYGRVVWMQWAGSTELNHEWYKNHGLKSDLNIYGKLNYEIRSRTHLFIDLQGRWINHSIEGIDKDFRDITQEHTYAFFNPKIGMTYQFEKGSTAYIYAGMAHREPNRSNFTDASPAAGVPKAEWLIDFEAGYTFRSNRYELSAGPYLMIYRQQLVITGEINDVGSPVMVNVDKSHRAGIEIISSLKLLRNVEWKANATISRNKIEEFTSYVDDWDTGEQSGAEMHDKDIAFSPGVTAGSRIIWSPRPQFRISLSSKYVSRQYIDNTSDRSRSLDPYLIHNLQSFYSLPLKGKGRLEFTLALNNFLNHQYESNAWVYRYIYQGSEQRLDGYFPQAGAHFLIGMNISLQ